MNRPVRDVHAPYVSDLEAGGDWAGLVRYWMAHQHPPAIDSAVALVRQWASQYGGRWVGLADYLGHMQENPFDPQRGRENPLDPDSFDNRWAADNWQPHELLTLRLLSVFHSALFCELAPQAPLDQQDYFFKLGILAANLGALYTPIVKDDAGCAMFLSLKGAAYHATRALDLALASYEEAVTIRRVLAAQRPEVYLPGLVSALNNLGNVQRDMGNSEVARSSFDEALVMCRALTAQHPQRYSAILAMTLHNLANAQLDMNELESSQASLKEAVDIRRALAAAQPSYLSDLAMTLNNLAVVESAMGDLESARARLKKTLEIRRTLPQTPTDLADLAMTLSNLGAAQRQLNDLEAALVSCEEALEVRRQLAAQRPGMHVLDVADTLNNLGNIQRMLNNSQSALTSYEEALEVYRTLAIERPEMFLPYVARLLNNMGTVQCDLNALESARRSCQESLEIRRALAEQRPDVYWPSVAATLNNLGTVQEALGDLKAALASYGESLAKYRELATPRPDMYLSCVAAALANLGNVQRLLNEMELARDSYLEAIELYERDARLRPTARLLERLACHANFGALLLGEGRSLGWPNYQAARAEFRTALACAEALRGMFLDPQQRSRVQRESLHAYERLIHACVVLWQTGRDGDALQEAIQVAEACRTRNLLELLADETLQPSGDPPEDLVARVRDLRRALRRVQRQLQHEQEEQADAIGLFTESQEEARGSSTRKPLAVQVELRQVSGHAQRVQRLEEERATLRMRYEAALEAIRCQFDPRFNPDEPVATIDFEAMHRLIPRDIATAVVHYTVAPEGGLALLLTRDGVDAVSLPNATDVAVRQVANEWLTTLAKRNSEGNFTGWGKDIDRLLLPVAQQAIQPVVERLAGQGIERLIVSPNRSLHVFPLHACRLSDGRYLADSYEVTYTPSLSILKLCADRHRGPMRGLLAVRNPTGDLAFAGLEVDRITRFHQAHTVVAGSPDLKERLIDESGEHEVWHYSGHCEFNATDPLDSAMVLDLARKERCLTLRDIFCALHLPSNVLTAISGCESGLLLPDRVDEYVNLPSGFLYAGAKCVVSSLWSVDDLSTTLLMERFYREWHGGKPFGAALREAQRWLREDITGAYVRDAVLTEDFLGSLSDKQRRSVRNNVERLACDFPHSSPFALPAHWAAFVASGLSFPAPA